MVSSGSLGEVQREPIRVARPKEGSDGGIKEGRREGRGKA